MVKHNSSPVGGWIAISAVLILGPRIGKYSDANKGKFTGSSFPLAVLGTLILWFYWFGLMVKQWSYG